MEKKLRYVDALRGIAILLVILVHTSQRVVGLGPDLVKFTALGQFGVQVFFVASAYTLCRSWQSRSGESDATRYFFVRRFFRIAPLYYFAILMYLLVTLTSGGENHYNLLNILANIFFVHGFVPSANNVIVPGGWSIGTEMAFYLLFPVAFGLFVSRTRFDWRVTAVAAFAILLIDLGLGRWLFLRGIDIDNNSFYYFNLITQLPVFLVGMTAYLIVALRGGGGGFAVDKQSAYKHCRFACFHLLDRRFFLVGSFAA